MTERSAMETDREAFAIVATIAEFYSVPTSIILGPNRQVRIVEMRRQACYLIRDLLDLSYEKIGRALGDMDASSVRHLERQAATRYGTDPLYANEIDLLRGRVKSTISEFRREIFEEEQIELGHDPLDIVRRIMKSPRGELHVSGAEIRLLAEAYFERLLGEMEARV